MTPRRISFARALFFSALLHGSLVAALTGSRLINADGNKEEVLVLDLTGLLSTRQIEERHAGEKEREPEPPPPEASPPSPPAPQPKMPKRKHSKAKPSPKVKPPPLPPRRDAVLPEAPSEAPPPEPEPTPPTASQSLGEGTQTQQGRSLSQSELEAAAMQRYISKLTQNVNARLVYPVEALAKGWTGEVTVRFRLTEDGSLVPGSLSVVTGSGRALLDEAALRAVTRSAPFASPPKPAEIRLTLHFSREDRK